MRLERRRRPAGDARATAARLARSLVLDACVWARDGCGVRVLPQPARELVAEWREGAGHDPRLTVLRVAPLGDALCLAYCEHAPAVAMSERVVRLLVSLDALYAVGTRRPELGERLAVAVRRCVSLLASALVTEADARMDAPSAAADAEVCAALAVECNGQLRLHTAHRLDADLRRACLDAQRQSGAPLLILATPHTAADTAADTDTAVS